jgi:peptidoglycan hydrolase-like protein with peptidoglycan-binding domain
MGAPIVSPTDAIVTRVGDGDDSGLYVSTANPGGESFRYMHLDTIAEIRAGDKLKAGDFIGTVGNTGNASGGAAHLHFEIHEDGDPTDPYPRLDGEFTFKEKISFLEDVFENYDGSTSEYAEFLVKTYPQELRRALNEKLSLPRPITQALKKAGIVDTSDLQKQLDQLIDSIPSLLVRDLSLGDSGPEVSLLQFFLIFRSDNAALRGAGATGYFGSITETALREYQRTIKVEETGVFDAETREWAGR